MFEQFPYTNFHDLNMDWIVKIAKDFLDQYSTIQETIANGLQDLDDKTAAGIADLQDKYVALDALLQAWYDTHSEDIATQLADALAAITTKKAQMLAQFTEDAEAKAAETIATIPADYTAVATLAQFNKQAIDNTMDALFYTCDFKAEDWEAGYYKSDTGENTGSNLYMRTVTTKYYNPYPATHIHMEAPEGYSVACFEYTPNRTYVRRAGGSISSGIQNYDFTITEGNILRFALGRFTVGDPSTNYLTDEFVSQIKIQFLTIPSLDDLKGITDGIFFNEKVSFSTSNWSTGYYSSTDGSYVSSNQYIRTAAGYYLDPVGASKIHVVTPPGYSIATFVFDADGIFIERIGKIRDGDPDYYVTHETGHKYKFALGRFSDQSASEHITTAFINSIDINTVAFKIPDLENEKLPKTGTYEFFNVTVNRPLQFGDETASSTTETIEAVLRLPNSYTRSGRPTRLILMCHGASGYVDAENSTWYNTYWTTFCNQLLAAGYALFDSNIFPTSTGTDVMGKTYGSPLYINALKKAYDYIVLNYNVYDKIFVHGTSMGGVGADCFVNTYPEICLAESHFAGRTLMGYIRGLYTGNAESGLGLAYGYTDNSALTSDHFSHADGCSPEMTIVKYASGAPMFPPDRQTAYSDWLAYYGSIYNQGANDSNIPAIAFRSVPLKSWESWNDLERYTRGKLNMQEAYRRGGSAPVEVVVYDSPTHTEMCYGQINDMKDQLIAWYKRFE